MILFVLIGFRRSNEVEQFEERDEYMRSKYLDPIEYFPDKNESTFRCTQTCKIYLLSVILFVSFLFSFMQINKIIYQKKK